VLREIAAADPAVVVLRLSRNFGHEAATTAGMDAATGDAVVLMDADLQDPPEVIEQMVQVWHGGSADTTGGGGGADIVYTVRRHRQGESAFKRSTSWLFYRLLRMVSDVDIPMDSGDFRLIDHKVVAALRQCREQDRFVRGLVAWTGFRTASVLYDRPPRHSGRTKYNPVKLLVLSVDAAIGFSIKPLRVATGVGFVVTLLSLALAGVVTVQKLVWGIPVQGYALLASGMFFLGGVQMLMLGLMGEYLGRVYRQAQGRPLYLVAETLGGQPDSPSDGGRDRATVLHGAARA
jgi:glycosyltransferase involved in cell wall biosynthesis